MAQTLAAKTQEIEQRRGELAALFTKHRKGESYDMPVEVVEEVNRRNDELSALVAQAEQFRVLEEIERKNAEQRAKDERPARLPFPTEDDGNARRSALGGAVVPAERKARVSLGDLFIQSVAFKGYRGGVGPIANIADLETKTLFQTSAGWDPEDIRTSRFIFDEQESPMVVDLFPKTTTTMSTVLYMEETTYTNNAAEVAEAGLYPEAALAVTEKSSEVRKIAVWIPVTDEQLEDETRVRDYINNRLRNMIMQRLDLQLLVGNGTAPNLRGVNNVVGINTQAKGADPVPDAIYKAMVLTRVNGFTSPNGLVIHPNDLQDLTLLRTADGIYIWGSPSDAVRMKIWGLNVVDTTYQTEGTAVVGDFKNFAELAVRRGIEFQITNAHDTFFVYGKQAIRCDMRVAAVFYRPKAFTTVTGI
jgi:hypothetical protein